MTQTRREFFKLITAIGVFTLVNPDRKTTPPASPPAKTLIGQELTRTTLLPPGNYDVVITDIYLKPSAIRPEDNIWFEFETVFGPKVNLKQVVSPSAPYQLVEMVRKTDTNKHNFGYLDLGELIGKQIIIKVKHVTYRDRKAMVVEQ